MSTFRLQKVSKLDRPPKTLELFENDGTRTRTHRYVCPVRCRDCRFCGKGHWGVEAFPVCRRGIHAFQVSNDGFCAWGERRADG